jgi:predicted membrane channel-forming protein YqfA (hemolysin III family)
MILSVAIDWALGFQGWSLSFAIPCTLLAVDVAVVVMMVLNHNSFQLYLMMQIYTTVFSIVLVAVILATGLTSFRILAFVAMGVSIVLLAGTVVFGDKKASSELRRRFRV